MYRCLVILPALFLALSANAEWKAGTARVCITPSDPIVLLGYGDRTVPFESVAEDIYFKALALEDEAGHRAVVVTADLVGFQAPVLSNPAFERIHSGTGLERDQILFNASHSHTGPLVSLDPWPDANPVAHAPLSEEDRQRTIAYSEKLQDDLVEVVSRAIAALRPADLSWGTGHVAFPMNRRLAKDGRVVMAENPDGETDRTVPVLYATTPAGAPIAVVFGCACHNTTLTGAHNVIAGDYAGYAQSALDDAIPGIETLFMSGCGADANPSPRGSFVLAREHGQTLAQEVRRVIDGGLTPISGELRTAFRLVELPLQSLDAAALADKAALPSAEAVMAKHMQRVVSEGGTLPENYSAPVALWQIGDSLTLVALPAEPVAAYARLVRETLGDEQAWVAGYNNDCFGYLPTDRVVEEGGHEAIGITLWLWGQNLRQNAGFFAPGVEKAVLDGVEALQDEVRRP